jgi:uncharacterized protein (DUF1501 family)
MSPAPVSRRDFLRQLGVGTATAVGAGYCLSVWQWGGAPAGAAVRAGDVPADAKGHTLVVVELGGGNDWLNTVVPHADGRYRDLRPTLAVTDPIDLDGAVGLHPNLAKLAKRFEAGDVAIVEGVGYDDPDLSHFGSFAIWWSAKGGAGTGGGWLGAYLDGSVGFDDPLAAVGLGPGPSPAMLGRGSFATTIADQRGLQPQLPAWVDDADALLDAWRDFAPASVDTDRLVGQVQRAVDLTVGARRDLTKALGDPAATYDETPSRQAQRQRYQDSSVADSLELAAQLVKSDARPRIVYINGIGDFDTHQGQAQRHPALMAQLDEGIETFFTTIGDASDKTVVMTVSEFGRRPAENGSGTDHGTANAHFVIGPKVKGGRYGEPADLGRLDRAGNLAHTSDFRRLYATGLAWLGVEDTEPVLGDDYDPFPVFR